MMEQRPRPNYLGAGIYLILFAVLGSFIFRIHVDWWPAWSDFFGLLVAACAGAVGLTFLGLAILTRIRGGD
jgi:hypothetical protein